MTPERAGRLRRRNLAWLAVLALCMAALIIAAVGERAGGAGPIVTSRPRATLAGTLTGPAPWPANVAGLRSRLAALGLPALAHEGSVLHIHEHLDVYVAGRRVTVPAGIGIDVAGGFISPLHTHDETGVIHVESPTLRTFTLGQFAGVWGVRLTPRCLGSYCTAGKKRVWVFVDGRRAHDPGHVILREHQEIVVAYGTRATLPVPIPSGYTFANGL